MPTIMNYVYSNNKLEPWEVNNFLVMESVSRIKRLRNTDLEGSKPN